MNPPRFWDRDVDPRSREGARLTRLLLTPFAWLYAAVTARRIANTVPEDVSAKVICVGNLTAGGVGKSPVVQALRDRIAHQTGLRVATLSRGYGGSLRGPLKVDPAVHTAKEVGDEPLMLSQSGESWIGVKRDQAGRMMSADGVDVIIMDDGHQNPSLHKDLSIVVIDSETQFGNGHVIPKGPLRETVTAGLARADLVVWVGGTTGDHPTLPNKSIPQLGARLLPEPMSIEGPVIGFAGIGRPKKFFESLSSLGLDISETVPFPDHHVYTRDDMNYLRHLASERRASLITTEKDLSRLSESDRSGIEVLPVSVEFNDETLLASLLAPLLSTSTDDG